MVAKVAVELSLGTASRRPSRPRAPPGAIDDVEDRIGDFAAANQDRVVEDGLERRIRDPTAGTQPVTPPRDAMRYQFAPPTACGPSETVITAPRTSR